MSDNQTAKRSVRARIRASIDRMPAPVRARNDEAIRRRVTDLPEWHAGSTLLLYHALPDEVQTRDLILAGLRAGKAVYLPRIDGEGIRFLGLRNAEALARLERHRFGMLEPGPDSREWSPAESPEQTLVLAPGRAFDLHGNRIGRGGGYYDRFLARTRSGTAAHLTVAGLCYEIQLLEEIPVGPTDTPVDMLVTEGRTLRF